MLRATTVRTTVITVSVAFRAAYKYIYLLTHATAGRHRTPIMRTLRLCDEMSRT